jgi:hypothetical protein
MKPFKVLVDLEAHLPDDRLYDVTVSEGRFINQFHVGHLSEDARRDLEEYMRHITRFGQWMQDEQGSPHFTRGEHTEPPMEIRELEIHMDRASENALGLQTCFPKITGDSFIWVVRHDLVTQDAIKEFDDRVAELHPKMEVWRPRKPSLEDLIMGDMDF